MIYLVLDTNFCLHFKSMDEYPWDNHFPNEKITLIITPILVEELDRKKYSGYNHLKQRAVKALKLIESSTINKFKNDVNVFLFNEVVNKNYIERFGLEYSDSDDKMIATILKYIEIHENENLYLVTNDLGPRLKVQKFKIKCIIPYEDCLLNSPMDEMEQKIKQLKLENESIKNIKPKLSIEFAEGGTLKKFRIIEKIKNRDEYILIEINKIKEKYKKYKLKSEIEEMPVDTIPNDLHSEIKNLIEKTKSLDHFGITEDSKVKYNEELETFYNEYEYYLNRLFDFEISEDLTIEIDFSLKNQGSSIAEDIDIFFHFPDGFELYIEENYPKEPLIPDSPRAPRHRFDFSVPPSPFINIDQNFRNFPSINSNVSSPSIKKTNSYDVNVHVTRVKHNMSESLDKMFIVFDTYDSINNFNVNYELRCANITDVVIGNLNFVFLKNREII